MTGYQTSNSPEEFREGYQLHDAAERRLVRLCRALGCTVERTGYDPHGPDGERVIGREEHATKAPDLRIGGHPVEVKTTRYREYLGNVAKRKWGEYPPRTWFAFFYVDRGTVAATGAYRKDRVTVAGENESPFGDAFVEPRPVGPLLDLIEAVAGVRGPEP